MIKDYNEYIFEQYGSNKVVEEITKIIFNSIGKNIKTLINDGEIIIDNISNSHIEFINPIIKIILSNRYYGNINIDKLTIKRGFIIDLNMDLELILYYDEIKNLKLDENNKIRNTIAHELLHMMEKYYLNIKNIENNVTWNRGKILSKLIDKYSNIELCKNWIDISHFIYLSLPHEQRARIQCLSTEIENMSYKDAYDYIINSKTYKDIEFLSRINIDIIMKKLKSDKSYKNYSHEFVAEFLRVDLYDDIYNRIDEYIIKYFKQLKKDNKKLLKKVRKIANSAIDDDIDFNTGGRDMDINYDDYL